MFYWWDSAMCLPTGGLVPLFCWVLWFQSIPGLLPHQSGLSVGWSRRAWAQTRPLFQKSCLPSPYHRRRNHGQVTFPISVLIWNTDTVFGVFIPRSMYFYLHIISLLIILLLPVRPQAHHIHRRPQPLNSVNKEKTDWYLQAKLDEETFTALERWYEKAPGLSSDFRAMFTCVFF